MISLFFVAFIWIIVFILICYNWYQDDGVLFFLDLNRIGMMIWSLGTALYDFALSDLYHPSLLINAVSLIVFVIFWFFASNSRKDVSLLKECFGELKIPNNIIYWFFLAGESSEQVQRLVVVDLPGALPLETLAWSPVE